MKKILSIVSIILVLSFALASCGVVTPPPTTNTESTTTTVTTTEPTPDEPKEDVVEIIDGYIWVNGVNTGIEAKPEDTPDVVEVIDGYIYVNGVNTGIQAKPEEKPDVIEIIDGYIWVNGVNTGIKAENCDHVWNTVTTAPTCTAGGYDTITCKICDKSYTDNETEQLEHTYESVYTIDDDYHWYKCVGCDDVKEKELHTLDDDGVCTICENPVSATPGILYQVSVDGTYAEVVGYEGTATKVKIAEEYNGLPVKNICDGAFKNNDSITNIVISDSITSIGDYAFGYCRNLISVIIPDSVTTIDQYAFYSCSNLTSVVIGDSVTSIGYYSFGSCSSLTSVIIGDSVTSIFENAFIHCHTSLYTEYKYGKYIRCGDNPYAVLIELTNNNMNTYEIHKNTKIIANGVFYGCKNLASITIPDSVTSIDNFAFEFCSNLTSVVIGDSVTNIGNFVFYYCSNLTSVVIGESVTSVGKSAFSDCTSLTSIEIPDSVTNIGDYAFSWCSSLTSIEIPDSVTSIGDGAFRDCTSLTIYCEATSKPSGWDSDWNYSRRPVVWGYVGE